MPADLLISPPMGFPEPGLATRNRQLLAEIIDGSLPEPACVRRLGLPRASRAGYGTVAADILLDDDTTWRRGVVFGGYLACLVDQFAALVMLTVLPDTTRLLTADVSVEFCAPVTTGPALVEARVLSLTSRQADVEVTISQLGKVASKGTAMQVLKH
jgi:uncharacterized protein (TIGR00369 family)